MKRRLLISKVGQAAQVADIEWKLVRQGAQHEIWRCGDTKVSIPRHREINELTANSICKHLEQALGKDWWR